MTTKDFLICLLFFLPACSAPTNSTPVQEAPTDATFYSKSGVERSVSFEAVYQTGFTSLKEFKANANQVSSYDVLATVKFLFGPLVNRSLASPQKGESVDLRPKEAYLENGKVMLPYRYFGRWIISRDAAKESFKSFPVPLNEEVLQTLRWKQCTDSDPSHQTLSFYWYFWDPERWGCDHQEGREYQNVELQFGTETEQTNQTYPEYDRMIRDIEGEKTLQMTFAFGYVEDPVFPQPFRDTDFGIREFQNFHRRMESALLPRGFQKQEILRADYGGSQKIHIGSRFEGEIDGVKVRVSVVAAAGVDQMVLFTHSFAADHDGFFGWFGHSRVGSGFDADRVRQMIRSKPSTFSITDEYQLIYWAGCNSYSYYTLPFFEMKATAQDPAGIRNLDLISNGLPSYFSLNAINAELAFRAMINWQKPTSYQSLVGQIEDVAGRSGITVLVNVLGDEDNPRK